VVLEVAFTDERRWESFYALPAVQAALDATPDPLKGLVVHRGRGGTTGTRLPRRPAPEPTPLHEPAAMAGGSPLA
jgi:hypothetical protein